MHDGDAGTNGPIVIDFPGPESCVDVERDVLREILRNPAGFYLDVHTVEYPDGAIRGQLA
ncbi:MAG: CHRD domain-containing protein [Acidimicrobiia bacterium]|nr:CHRD domain-containing protein [Acidimicrobiia bacterium]